MKINDKIFLTEETNKGLMLPDGIEFIIKDILEEDVPYNIVIGAEEFGEDWCGFVCLDEIKIK